MSRRRETRDREVALTSALLRRAPQPDLRGDRRSAARADPRVIGHALELLRLAENGEIDCLLYIAQRAPSPHEPPAMSWVLGGAGERRGDVAFDVCTSLRRAAVGAGPIMDFTATFDGPFVSRPRLQRVFPAAQS